MSTRQVRQSKFSYMLIGFTIGIALALAIVSAVIFISEIITEIDEIHEVVLKLEKVE